MTLKKWQSIILELVTLLVCSIGTHILINSALGNPLNIEGLGAHVGAVTFPLAISFALAGIIVAIRLIWKKNQKLAFFLNATWLLSILTIWIDFLPYYGEGKAFSSMGYFIVQMAGMALWLHCRKQSFLAISTPEHISNEFEDVHIMNRTETKFSQSSTKMNDYNLTAKIFLVYFILEEIANIVRAVSELKVSSYLGISTGMLIAEISIDAILIIAAAFSFKPRKYALVCIILLLALKTFAVFPKGTAMGLGYAIGANIAYLIRDFAPFAIALCFKKDGVSGWQSFFTKNGSQPTREVTEEPQTHNFPKDIPGEELSAMKPTSANTEQENPIVETAKKRKQRFHFDWCRWKTPLLIAGIASIATVITIVAVNYYNQIEYFYLKDNTVHLNRHCEPETIYVPADAILKNNSFVYCSKCISNRKMRKIEERQDYYRFISEEYMSTPNIKLVREMMSQDYTDVGENAAEFANMLLKKNNRDVLLTINRTEGYGNWGDDISGLEQFLYNGYSMFKIGEQVYYIPDAELNKFKRLHPEAIEYSFE